MYELEGGLGQPGGRIFMLGKGLGSSGGGASSLGGGLTMGVIVLPRSPNQLSELPPPLLACVWVFLTPLLPWPGVPPPRACCVYEFSPRGFQWV